MPYIVYPIKIVDSSGNILETFERKDFLKIIYLTNAGILDKERLHK